jgi:outer membrane lipoprotein-sorting protein
MSLLRYSALFLLLGTAILLTGALSSQPVDPSPASLPPELCAAAVNTLDQAISRLDPGRVAWLQTTVWQKACFEQFSYETEGRYLTAPDNRFRLELTTRQGNGIAQYLVVSDGKEIWEGTRFSDGAWLPGPRDAMQQVFGGVVPLLHTLRSTVTWVKRETVRRQGRIFIKLTGTVAEPNPDLIKSLDPRQNHHRPSQARVYLDEQTLWPHRIEWWARSSSGSSNILLVQMELRDPHFNQRLTVEQYDAEFRIPSSER